jgi:hypothetical protein
VNSEVCTEVISNEESIKIVEWLEKRWIMEKKRKGFSTTFPSKQMCKITSVFILLFLRRKYYPYCFGWRLCGGSGPYLLQPSLDLRISEDGGYKSKSKWVEHFWIQNNMLAIDLTSDQFFSSKNRKYIMRTNSAYFNNHYNDTASDLLKRKILSRLKNDRLVNKWLMEAEHTQLLK